MCKKITWKLSGTNTKQTTDELNTLFKKNDKGRNLDEKSSSAVTTPTEQAFS